MKIILNNFEHKLTVSGDNKDLTWQLDRIPWIRAWLFEKVCNSINVHPQTVVAVGLATIALLAVSISFSLSVVKIFEPIHLVKNLNSKE